MDEAKLREELIRLRDQSKATAETLEGLYPKIKEAKEERDALVELLNHLCPDCLCLVPTVLRVKFEKEGGLRT